jgi:hypothetical protein
MILLILLIILIARQASYPYRCGYYYRWPYYGGYYLGYVNPYYNNPNCYQGPYSAYPPYGYAQTYPYGYGYSYYYGYPYGYCWRSWW